MQVINARNAEYALHTAVGLMRERGRPRGSRNGDVLVLDDPVTTVYEKPLERVVFSPARDANPFFHLYEALWMIGGRNDLAPLEHFVRTFGQFSDDGETLHGAYGHRWRHAFGMDQLRVLADALRRDPDDRRCVLQMWDCTRDLAVPSKDVPCNTQVYFARGWTGELNMTVTCRSNDIVWGAYGANAVHFGFLLEYMAALIDCPVGRYWQVSNNWHAYRAPFERLERRLEARPDAHYIRHAPYPLVAGGSLEDWHGDLDCFLAGSTTTMRDPFFSSVAVPLVRAYRRFRDDDLDAALEEAHGCVAPDWRRAALEWLNRRKMRREESA